MVIAEAGIFFKKDYLFFIILNKFSPRSKIRSTGILGKKSPSSSKILFKNAKKTNERVATLEKIQYNSLNERTEFNRN